MASIPNNEDTHQHEKKKCEEDVENGREKRDTQMLAQMCVMQNNKSWSL